MLFRSHNQNGSVNAIMLYYKKSQFTLHVTHILRFHTKQMSFVLRFRVVHATFSGPKVNPLLPSSGVE